MKFTCMLEMKNIIWIENERRNMQSRLLCTYKIFGHLTICFIFYFYYSYDTEFLDHAMTTTKTLKKKRKEK